MARSASLLLLVRGQVLLLKRSGSVEQPQTWGLPGGYSKPREKPFQTALREAVEEVGPLPKFRVISSCRHGSHTAFVATAPRRFRPVLNWEHTSYAWIPVGIARHIDLHPGVRRLLDERCR